MNDLDSEDCKKDTLVDVVFKKALKEFRQNIFSFYSSALAVSYRRTTFKVLVVVFFNMQVGHCGCCQTLCRVLESEMSHYQPWKARKYPS